MKNKKFSKSELFALICSIVFGVMTIAVFALDSIIFGISDVFPFFLGLFTVSMAYLFRKSVNTMMFVFITVCGGLISLISIIEQILNFNQ